jgi:uncharacterized delta-60 repeat protein
MKKLLYFIYISLQGAFLTKWTTCMILLFFGLGNVSIAQPGAIDFTFNPNDIGFGNGDGANLDVLAIAVQPDGKIIIGGGFVSYNGVSRSYIARLNVDGSLDTSFDPGLGGNNYVHTIVIQPDEKIIIGGAFTSYNGTIVNHIARLNPDGSMDDNFYSGSGASGLVESINLQADGKIIIGGDFTSYNGVQRIRVARLNENGILDSSFVPGTGPNKIVFAITLLDNGKILIGGEFDNYNGIQRIRMARLNSNGTLDNSFNPGTGANNFIQNIAVQPDGKILVGGFFTSFNGTEANRIVRLNSNGTTDATFNPIMGANNHVRQTIIQPDGRIVICGWFTTFNGILSNRIARLNSDGTLDDTFDAGTGANNYVNSAALQPDGQILIGGLFTTYNGIGRNRIIRLTSDASLDYSFNPGTGANNNLQTVALQPDGKIIVAGGFTSFNGTGRNYIARLNVDGTMDTDFDPGLGANNWIYSTAVQSDGKILIGGLFTNFNGVAINRIARLSTSGTLDATFNPGTGTNDRVFSTMVQSDGKILLGGRFTSFNGTNKNYIARLNADGSVDNTFIPGTAADSLLRIIVLQPDGKILIGGRFINFNGIKRSRIARLNANGTVDVSFNPGSGTNGTVEAIAVQSDGRIIIGGSFTSFNGTTRNHIARLNTDGTLDNTFIPDEGTNNDVLSIAIQPDGKIIVVGAFTSCQGSERNYIARLNTNGSLDNTFDPGSGAQSWIYTTAIQENGKIIIGGAFTSYDGTGRNRLARLLNCSPAAGTDIQFACNSFTWIDGNIYTTSNNTAIYNYLGGAANGCDSLVTLNLTIIKVDTSVSVSVNTLTSNAAGATYQWLDCDNGYAAINGETNQSFTPTLTGNYAVVITMEGCTDTSSCYNVMVSSTEVMNQEELLIVYPNPFSSQATLWSALPLHNATLTIENAFGQTVAQMKNVNGQSILLSRDNLASGMHFLQLTQDNRLLTTKKILIRD